MNQKKNVGINMFLALLLVVSTFTVVALAEGEEENLLIEKQVWDQDHWAEEIEADLGEILTFNITVDYHVVNETDGYEGSNLVVVDSLPTCLEYVEESAEIEYGDELYTGVSQIDGKDLTWNLTEEWSITLEEDDEEVPQKVYIFYHAEVVAYTDEVGELNTAVVTGTEHCSDEGLYGTDDALVVAVEPENPELTLTKEVWDNKDDVWTKDAVVGYDSDAMFFRINVTNSGNVDLTNVVVKDVLPAFLIYDDSSCIPSVQEDEYIEWGPFELAVGESMVFTVDTTILVNGVETGENYVNATACEMDHIVEDTVEVTVKEHLHVDKQVKVGYEEGWQDGLDYVIKDSYANFKITTTYNGDGFIDCGVVGDFLPGKYEYLETTKVTVAGDTKNPEDADYPVIVVGADTIVEYCDCESYDITTIVEDYDAEYGTLILWDFNVPDFDLSDGDSIEIEFATSIGEYSQYCGTDYCTFTNAAAAIMGGCCANTFTDFDKLDVTFCPPPCTFTKQINDGEELVDEIEAYTGETVEFELDFDYYGLENLTDLQFVDMLPCTLEYVEDSAIISIINGDQGIAGNFEPEFAEETNSIWWTFANYESFENLSLEDNSNIKITFDVLVVEPSTCCDCEGGCENVAWVYGILEDSQDLFEMTDSAYVTSYINHKPEVPDVDGPNEGEVGEELTFKTTINDEDDDQVYYKVKFTRLATGDDSEATVVILDWAGPYESGEEIEIDYTFTLEGTYEVSVKAKDEHGAESAGWTEYPLVVEISKGEEPEPEFEVAITTNFGFGKVDACIKNNAEYNMTDVDWKITAKGGMLGKVNISNNGTIETLESDGCQCISTLEGGKIKFALGRLTVNATATVDGKVFFTEANGFVIGRLVIFL